MKHLCYLLLGALLLPACQSRQPKELPQIDILHTYPEKTVCYQDIGEVTYIPLETTEDVLLGVGRKFVHVSDNYLVAFNPGQGDIMVFDGKGRIRHYFNHMGQGAEEYGRIQHVVADEKNGELFVYATSPVSRYQVYTFDGTFKRTLPSPAGTDLKSGYNWDDTSLLCYDEYDIHGTGYRTKPYLFLSKQDGTITSELDITFPVRFGNRIIRQTAEGRQAIVFVFRHSRYAGTNFLVGEIYSDTIWQANRQQKLTPVLTKTPSVHTTDPRTILTPLFKTDRFIVLEKATLKLSDSGRLESDRLIHEFSTGETSRVTFESRDCPSVEPDFLYDVSTPDNVAVCLLEAFKLKEAYNDNTLPEGELKRIAATISEDDNGVLMLVKCK